MEFTLVDTGIWIAMFDPRDQHRDRIEEISEYLEICHLVMPWPTLYETLRTRFVRRPQAVQGLEKLLKRPNISFLDDAPYRQNALQLCFSTVTQSYRALSMTDCLIRLILEDVNNKISSLATFNHKDFFDVCSKRQIEMI